MKTPCFQKSCSIYNGRQHVSLLGRGSIASSGKIYAGYHLGLFLLARILFCTAGTNLICNSSSKNLLFVIPFSEGAQGSRLLRHSSNSAFSAGEKSAGAWELAELADLASEAAAPVLFLGVVVVLVVLEVLVGAGAGAGVGAGAGAVLLVVELVELAEVVVLVVVVVLEELLAGGASWMWALNLSACEQASIATSRITVVSFMLTNYYI